MISKGSRAPRRSRPDSGFFGFLVAWWMFSDSPTPPADDSAGDAAGGEAAGDAGGAEEPDQPERRRRGSTPT